MGDMGSAELTPGEAVDVTETAEVDICENTTFTTTTEVILDEPSNSIPCTDTEEHEWKL